MIFLYLLMIFSGFYDFYKSIYYFLIKIFFKIL